MVQRPSSPGAHQSLRLVRVSHRPSQIVDIYRSKLRDDTPGIDGDEIARQRIEAFANKIRPAGFLVRA